MPANKQRRSAAPSKLTRPAGRRNPDAELEGAIALNTKFHGRDTRRIVELLEADNYRSALADLGRLIELDILPPAGGGVRIQFGGNIRVAAAADGGQLYFLGGDQTIDPQRFGLARADLPKDDLCLGQLVRITYFTSKDFHNFEPTNYTHRFAEQRGHTPVLGYNVLNRKLYLVGGSYQVKRSGIVN